MADLDPAHVEAVARAMDQAVTYVPTDANRAEAILTSTDPDVHAAMLAALVRAGVCDDRERTSERTSNETAAPVGPSGDVPSKGADQ